jgi:Flp pilus assembly protein TadB
MSAITREITETPQATRWPLERVLFLMAGIIVLASVVLAVLISPWFLLLTAFAGLNQLMYVAFGTCGAALILTHVFHLQKGCAR